MSIIAGTYVYILYTPWCPRTPKGKRASWGWGGGWRTNRAVISSVAVREGSRSGAPPPNPPPRRGERVILFWQNRARGADAESARAIAELCSVRVVEYIAQPPWPLPW